MMVPIFTPMVYCFSPGCQIPLIGDSEQRNPETLKRYQRIVAKYANEHWLEYLGTEGASGSAPNFTSYIAPDSSIAFLRKDWTAQSPFVCMNVGYGNGWHSHYDFLSVLYYQGGEWILRDSMVENYIRHPYKLSEVRCTRFLFLLERDRNMEIPILLMSEGQFLTPLCRKNMTIFMLQ